MLIDEDAIEQQAMRDDHDARAPEPAENTQEKTGTRLSVELSEGQLRSLQERASRLGVSVQDLARVAILDLLDGPGEEFLAAKEHILSENAELYRRLA